MSIAKLHPTLKDAVSAVRSGVLGIVLLSAVLNLLALTGSLYMMLIYDRVLPSMSVPTLVTLTFIVAVLFLFNAIFDGLRLRVMIGVGGAIDRRLAHLLLRLETRALRSGHAELASVRPLRELSSIRGFMGSTGPAAIVDLPWVVFFIAVLSLLHPLLGLTTLVGTLILAALTMANERASFQKVKAANAAHASQSQAGERLRRHTDTMRGLGMIDRMVARTHAEHHHAVLKQEELAEHAARYGAAGRSLRLLIQSAVLAVGAWLAIDGQASAGIIFAASILAGRALAPVDQAIANWRNFTSARQAWARLNGFLSRVSELPSPTIDLPAPAQRLTGERLVIAPPGSDRIALANAQFELTAGDRLAVIGPSGAGKSTLARALANVWPLSRGSLRLDGADYAKWPEEVLGRFIGYLPQTVDLFPGTLAENISRFDPEASSADIISAAEAAGIHEFILSLPDGYDAQISDEGDSLSGGQRQRIGLARALYGRPFLVVLDEPGSNLDPVGEKALAQAIRAAGARGAIVVFTTHSPAMVRAANKTLLLREGTQQAFDETDKVLASLARTAGDEPQYVGSTSGPENVTRMNKRAGP